MGFPMLFRTFFAVMLLAVLAACSSGPGGRGGSVGQYKVGNPYQINGEWYSPAEDYGYDETGLASWYGNEFHGKSTANGETFDANELTAAHRTLPMPSLVRVTNLENGRSIVVRINDRGPFAAGRIIDISRRGAQLLGFESNGVAKVRVSILEPESRALAEGAKKSRRTAVASSDKPAATPPMIKPIEMADLGKNVPQENIPEPGSADGNEETAGSPQNARMEAVDAVPLDAPPGTEAASESNVVVAEPTPTKLPPVTGAQPPKQVLKTIPGKRVDGRFYPAPKVEQRAAVPSARIYVQAGAFTVKENATRLKDKLATLAPATVSEAVVNGKNFYRVRLGPIKSVAEADAILTKVLGQKNPGARITVE